MCAILRCRLCSFVFFFQAEDGIRDYKVTGVQTCALPILISAGGMLPVAYALLAEIMPTRHRGWSLVVVGGIGALGGFFAASSLSARLQPAFGWRIMWFLNLPPGLIPVPLRPLLPESPRSRRQAGGTS